MVILSYILLVQVCDINPFFLSVTDLCYSESLKFSVVEQFVMDFVLQQCLNYKLKRLLITFAECRTDLK